MGYASRRHRAAMLAGSALCALAGLTSAAATAQPPAPQAAPADATAAPPEEKAPDEIVVVGSQIQGAKVNAALPVTVVSRAQIQASAAISGDELFRTIPEAGNVGFNSSVLPGTSNSARGDVSSVNLRSIGAGSTLVLINGRRTVVHPTSQAESLVPVFTYNTNAIPVGGVERVEVLRDGAAAIYGTDAVAGVINTVLQSNYDGAKIDGHYGFAQGTHMKEGSVSGTFGKNFGEGRGNFTLFATGLRRSALRASDQDYTAYSNELPLFAGTPFATATSLDMRSTTSTFGQFATPAASGVIRSNGVAVTGATGIFHIAPQTNPNCGIVSPTYAGTCVDAGAIATSGVDRNLRIESASFGTTVVPRVTRINLFGTFRYELTPEIVFYSEQGFYHAKSRSIVGSTGFTANTSTTITVPTTSYWNPFGATLLPNGQVNPNRLPGLSIAAAGVPVTISNYNFVDVGATPVIVTNNQYRFLGGFKGKIHGWNFDTAGLYTWATVNDKSFAISSTKLAASLALSTPDAYNPFNGGSLADPSYGDATPSSSTALNSLLVPIYRKNKTTLALGDFKVSRPDLLPIWGGGDVGIALGVEVRHETYRDNRDSRIDGTIGYTNPVTGAVFPTDSLGIASSPDVAGKRTVASAFAELQVPVISPDMDIPLVNRIDVQLAGRAEHYSDVGSVAKPKIAGNWDIIPGIRLRGSWDKGFRAPNLEQLNVTTVSRSNTRTDYIFCEADRLKGLITSYNSCTRTQLVQARRAGNPNLKPETSTSYSFGVVLEPRFIPSRFGHLTFTADIWKIKQKNIIGVFGEGNAVIVDYFDRLNGTTNPLVHRAAPTPEQILAFAGTPYASNVPGTILYVDDQYVNQQPQEAGGVDLGLAYTLKTDRLGTFSLTGNASHQNKLYQAPTAGIQALLDARAAGQINPGVTLTGAGSLIGQNGTPAWRGAGSMTWRFGPVSADWFANYVGKYYSTALTNSDGSYYQVPHTWMHNVSVSYEFQKGGLSGTRFRVGARNVFDTDPPLVSGGYTGSLYNPYGRYIYFDISKTF